MAIASMLRAVLVVVAALVAVAALPKDKDVRGLPSADGPADDAGPDQAWDVATEVTDDDQKPGECVQVVHVSRIVHVEPTSTAVSISASVDAHRQASRSASVSRQTTLPALTLASTPPAMTATLPPEVRVVPVPLPVFKPVRCTQKPCVVRVPQPVPVPIVVRPPPCPTVTAVQTTTVYEASGVRYVECGSDDDERSGSVARYATATAAFSAAASASAAAAVSIAASMSLSESVFASVSAEFSSVMTLMTQPTLCPARKH
jgi:hypothetical protein